MKKRPALIVILALVATMALCGCQTPRQPTAGSVAVQQTEAPDGVTAEEYEAAYLKFSDCMRDAGTPLVDERMDGSIHLYSYLAEKEREAAICYKPFSRIDAEWQLANQYETESMRKLRDCLLAVGVTPADTVRGVFDQLDQAGIVPGDCVETAD